MTDPRPPAAGTTDGSGGTSPDVTDTCDGLRLETSRPADGTVVVAVTGELDMLTAPELRHAVAEQISAASLVVLDLDGVRFLGTSGLAALIELREQAHRAGVELRHHLFDIHDDEHAEM